jgi:LEA14-like dessication related protein
MRLLPFIILGGAATWYFLRMRSLGTNVKFILRNIKVKGGSVIQPNIILTLGVQNPTNNEAIIRSITGSVIYENKNIAQFSNFQTTTIKRNSETLLTVTAIPNILSIISVLNSVIMQKQSGAVIEIKGTANVNNVTVPFNSSLQF